MEIPKYMQKKVQKYIDLGHERKNLHDEIIQWFVSKGVTHDELSEGYQPLTLADYAEITDYSEFEEYLLMNIDEFRK